MYKECKIFIATDGEDRDRWVAACAGDSCGYYGEWFTSTGASCNKYQRCQQYPLIVSMLEERRFASITPVEVSSDFRVSIELKSNLLFSIDNQSVLPELSNDVCERQRGHTSDDRHSVPPSAAATNGSGNTDDDTYSELQIRLRSNFLIKSVE